MRFLVRKFSCVVFAFFSRSLRPGKRAIEHFPVVEREIGVCVGKLKMADAAGWIENQDDGVGQCRIGGQLI